MSPAPVPHCGHLLLPLLTCRGGAGRGRILGRRFSQERGASRCSPPWLHHDHVSPPPEVKPRPLTLTLHLQNHKLNAPFPRNQTGFRQVMPSRASPLTHSKRQQGWLSAQHGPGCTLQLLNTHQCDPASGEASEQAQPAGAVPLKAMPIQAWHRLAGGNAKLLLAMASLPPASANSPGAAQQSLLSCMWGAGVGA